MLYRNLPLKAASVLLAIFLWFWVMLSEENPIVPRSVRLPIAAEGIERGLTLGTDLPEAEVKLRGLKRDVEDLKGAVRAFVSCRGLDADSYRLNVHVRAPNDVTVVSVRPTEVAVALERIVSQGRQVEVRFVGEPQTGHEMKKIEHAPKVVRVSGPRSRVDRVARVVATADLSRVVSGIPIAVVARALDAGGSEVAGVSLAPARVTVTAVMEPVVVARTLPVTVRTRGLLPRDLRLVAVRVEPPMVTVLLPASQAEEVTHVDTQEVALSDLHGSVTRSVRLVPPENVRLAESSQVTVMLEVKRVASPAVSPFDSKPAPAPS